MDIKLSEYQGLWIGMSMWKWTLGFFILFGGFIGGGYTIRYVTQPSKPRNFHIPPLVPRRPKPPNSTNLKDSQTKTYIVESSKGVTVEIEDDLNLKNPSQSELKNKTKSVKENIFDFSGTKLIGCGDYEEKTKN